MEANNDLLADSRREHYLNYGVGLYKAALSGNWGAAAKIYRAYPTCFSERITKKGDTALHIAAVAGHADFVARLVNLMVTASSPQVLDMTNHIGNTALCFAAVSGVVAIAEAMVNNNRDLPRTRNNHGLTPLLMAAMLGNRDMVDYLLSMTPLDYLTPEDRSTLFISSFKTDFYGKLLPPSTFAN